MSHYAFNDIVMTAAKTVTAACPRTDSVFGRRLT